MGQRSPDILQATGTLSDVVGHQDLGGGVKALRRRSWASFVTDAIGAALGSVATDLAAKFTNEVSGPGAVLGRVSAGAGAVEELDGEDIQNLLAEFAGDVGSGAAKGLVPAVAPGDAAARKILGAEGWRPENNAGLKQLGAGLLPTGVSNLDITSIPATYAALIVQLTGVSSTTASTAAVLSILASVNAGGTFPITLYTSADHAVQNGETLSYWGIIVGYQAAAATMVLSKDAGSYYVGPSDKYVAKAIDLAVVTKAATINTLRIALSAGNFDAGTYAVYGIN